MFLLWKT